MPDVGAMQTFKDYGLRVACLITAVLFKRMFENLIFTKKSQANVVFSGKDLSAYTSDTTRVMHRVFAHTKAYNYALLCVDLHVTSIACC